MDTLGIKLFKCLYRIRAKLTLSLSRKIESIYRIMIWSGMKVPEDHQPKGNNMVDKVVNEKYFTSKGLMTLLLIIA